MSAAIVWMDHNEAKIFRLAAGQKPGAEKVESSAHGRGAGHSRKQEHDLEKFFHDVARQLESTKEVLLVGSGTGKQEFRHFLEKHRPVLAKNVVGDVTVDHPTEPQMLALARKYFKTYDLYSGT